MEGFLCSLLLPADTDVFKAPSGRLKKSRRLTNKPDVTASGKRRFFDDVLKMSDLRRPEDV